MQFSIPSEWNCPHGPLLHHINIDFSTYVWLSVPPFYCKTHNQAVKFKIDNYGVSWKMIGVVELSLSLFNSFNKKNVERPMSENTHSTTIYPHRSVTFLVSRKTNWVSECLTLREVSQLTMAIWPNIHKAALF